MILVAALAPWFAPFSPSEQFSAYVLKGPGAGGQHVLGTDEFGRDLLRSDYLGRAGLIASRSCSRRSGLCAGCAVRDYGGISGR